MTYNQLWLDAKQAGLSDTQACNYATDELQKLSELSRPFDKLKELWDEWHHPSIFSTFEMFIWCHYMNGEWATFITDTDKQVHKWLAEHCGFLTTAEVRQTIQEFKNQ